MMICLVIESLNLLSANVQQQYVAIKTSGFVLLACRFEFAEQLAQQVMLDRAYYSQSWFKWTAQLHVESPAKTSSNGLSSYYHLNFSEISEKRACQQCQRHWKLCTGRHEAAISSLPCGVLQRLYQLGKHVYVCSVQNPKHWVRLWVITAVCLWAMVASYISCRRAGDCSLSTCRPCCFEFAVNTSVFTHTDSFLILCCIQTET